MTWSTSTAELRTLLNDGPTDRLRYRKKVFGDVKPTNFKYRTFEYRRVTDFTTASEPLCVWLSGVPLANTLVSADSPATGDFTLKNTVVIVDGDIIEASYYVQWFLDTELAEFTGRAASWLGLGVSPTVIEEGLRPCALKFSAGEAYQKLAIKMSESYSEMFKLEDSPKKENKSFVETYLSMAKAFKAEALLKVFLIPSEMSVAFTVAALIV
jgi:hypothetical protein